MCGCPTSLFKHERHSGHAEFQVYLIDADSGEFINKSPTMTGAAQYDDHTILLVINFTRNDISEPKQASLERLAPVQAARDQSFAFVKD